MGNSTPPQLNPADILFPPQSESTPNQDFLNQWLGPDGYEQSQRAGLLEGTAAFGMSVAKSAADGIVNLGTLAFRGLAAQAGSAAGMGFQGGWDHANKLIERTFGTKSPGAADVMGKALGVSDTVVYDPYSQKLRKVPVGEATDIYLQRKLGNYNYAANAGGMLLSFGGPVGKAIGGAGEAAVRPLAQAIERGISKKLLTEAARRELIDPDTIERLARSGRGFEVLSRMPEWQATAGLYNKLLNLGGRNVTDLMSTAGANMVQSYALLPDEHRMRGLLLGAATAPLAVPLAKLGSLVGSKIMAGGLSPEQAMRVKSIYESLEAGNYTIKEAVQQWNNVVPGINRLGSVLVSSAIEGTAFTMLEPDAIEDAYKWSQGDSEAGSRVIAMMMGSAAGLAALRYGVPADMAPMFKSIRPDLNKLDIFLEAEAARQAEPEIRTRMAQDRAAKKDQPQEPVQPVKVKKPKKGKTKEVTTEEIMAEMADIANQPRQYTQDEIMGELADSYAKDIYDQKEAELKQRFAWANKDSQPLLRAGFEAKVVDDNTIMFQMGKDHSVYLGNEGGEVVLDMSPRTAEVLKEFGRDATGYDMLSPDRIRFRGEKARQMVDDVTMLGLFRQMDADLDHTLLGRVEVQGKPGWWMDPETGVMYRAQLDGSRVRQSIGEKPSTENVGVLRDFTEEQPIYESPSMAALAELVAIKAAVAPDPITDGILTNAVLMARHSHSEGANSLREFFDGISPEELISMVNADSDKVLAFQLASMAAGTSNPMFSRGELAQMMGAKQAAKAAKAVKVEGESATVPMDQGEPMLPGMDQPLPKGQVDRVPEQTLADMLPRGEAEVGSMKLVTREQAQDILDTSRRVGTEGFSPQRDLLYGRGDDAYADEVRYTVADWRRSVGEVQPLLEKAEKAAKGTKKTLKEEIDTEVGRMARWKALVEGHESPKNPAEREFTKSARDVMRATYGQLREAGAVRRSFDAETGEARVEPLGTPELPKVPRSVSEKGRKNLLDKEFRTDFLEHMIEKNNLQTRDAETGELRPMTAEEANMRLFGQESSTSVETAGRQSAAEFSRELKYYPDTYKGKEILTNDVFESLKNIVHQQAGRAATIRRFGPDLSAAERKQLAEMGVDVSRPGVRARLDQFIARTDPNSAKVATDLVTMLEGGSPSRMNWLLRMVYNADMVPRALLTSASFVQDIGDLFIGRNLIYGGWRRGIQTAFKVVTSPKEGIILAERLGTLLRGTGARDANEAASWWQKVADMAASVGTMTEKIKTGAFTRLAEAMVKDWGRGRSTENDRWVVAEMLKFSPEQQKALLSGKADADLTNAFVQEFVQLATSRRLAHEGSRLAGNPNFRSLVRFTNWATGNLLATARIYKSASKDVFSGDPKRMAMGTYRAVRATGLLTATGVVGQMFAYAVMDMFRGENGFKRYFQEMSYAPGVMLMKAFGGQVLGGPYAQLVSAMGNPLDPKSWTGAISPLSWLFSIGKAGQSVDWTNLQTMMKTVPDAAASAVTDAALPSWAKAGLATMAGAGMAGADPRAVTARRQASSFMRIEGIEQPTFPKSKPEEYYDLMRTVAKAVSRHPEDPAMAWRDAEDAIRKALELAPEESVAASLRSYQIASRIPDDKMDSFIEFMGDDQMRYIFAHDQAISDLAKFAGVQEGTPIRPFDSELASTEKQARLGRSNAWDGIVDRAVDEAAARMEAGESTGYELRALAESAAAFPEQQTWLSERQLRSLTRGQTYAEIANRLERLLIQRARGRKESTGKRRGEMEQQFGVGLQR